MFFCFFSSLIRSITLPTGLWIEDHSDDPLAPCTDDEGVSTGGVISPPRLYLLPAHVVCNSNFNLVVVFFHFLFEHTIHYMIDCCLLVYLLFPLEEPLWSPNISPTVLPFLHVLQFPRRFLSNPCQGRFSIPKSFVDSIPPPPISCIPKTHWKLIEYHMDAF